MMESSFCGMRARPIPQAIGALESWMSRNGSVLSIFQTKTLLWMTPFSLASPNKKADSVIKRYPALLRQLNHTISGQSRRQSHEDSRNDHMQRAPILTIHQTRTPDIHGSALLASLIMTAILSMALASYLSLSQKQSVSVARSQAWNAAIPVAESGVEEALAQLNRGVGAGSLNLAANGWEQKSTGAYGPQQPRYLGSSFYKVIVVPGAAPVIYSTGYVAAPFGASPISRAVQVNTSSN